MGEQPHGNLKMIVGTIFGTRRLLWGVRPLGDVRVQVGPTRYRIPDVCILRNTDPKDPIIRFPPLLCIEIFSKGDTISELQDRVNDYAGMGVGAIWAIDPWKRRGYHASVSGFEQPADGILRVAGTPIEVSLAQVFAEMDQS